MKGIHVAEAVARLKSYDRVIAENELCIADPDRVSIFDGEYIGVVQQNLFEVMGEPGWTDLAAIHTIEGMEGESGADFMQRRRGELVLGGMAATEVDAMPLVAFVAALRGEKPATPNSDGSVGATKSTPSKSTSKENLEKAISALCSFHLYDNGVCDDLVPKTARELAEAAGVSEATMSRKLSEVFGKGHAGGYRNYQIACQSKTLGAILASHLDESPIDAHELREDWGDRPSDRRRRPKGSESGDD